MKKVTALRLSVSAFVGLGCLLVAIPWEAVQAKPPGTNIQGSVARWVDFELQGVKGATVYAIHESLGLVCTTTTGSNGDWRCDDVPPGDLYTIQAEKITEEETCGGSISFGPVRRNRTTTFPGIIMDCFPALP